MLGAPGVGKGTQGRQPPSLRALDGCALISTGEILREAVAGGTPLGLEARRQMDSGQLVDDDVMIGLVRERTSEPDTRNGFVLDGFPRTVPQAEALDAMLAEREQGIEAVLYLAVSEDELVRRLNGRRECPVCKRAFNPEGAPARDGLHCDDHPAVELRSRPDDSEEVVRHRFAEFWAKTAPLVDYYTVTGRLRPVAGTGTVDGVFEALRREAGCGSRTPQTN
jgi:adenylate kinase